MARTKWITISLPKETNEKVDRLSERLGLSKADTIIKVIDDTKENVKG